MKQLLFRSAIAILFIGGTYVPNAHASTSINIEELLKQIQTLTSQLEDIKKQLADVKKEVHETLKDNLHEGMTDEDIKKIQEILATDTSIYPQGKITGFFGPMTKEAIKRFQHRHNLGETGELDDDTKAWFEAYLSERYNGHTPPGLLKAPGIVKKVEKYRNERLCERSEKNHLVAKGVFCKKIQNTDDTSDDENDTDFNVRIYIKGVTTTVSFVFEDTNYMVKVTSTSTDDILEAVADALDVDTLDADLSDEISDVLRTVRNTKKQHTSISLEKKRAQKALLEAQEEIDDVKDEMDDEETNDEADELLEKAKEKLLDAEEAFNDEEYKDAKLHAEEAEELAEDAKDALE
jgi:regulator of replication initiation timing